MSIKKQFWIDLVVVILSISIVQYFKEDKADELGLVLRFIVIFGCFCMYRIMSFLQLMWQKAMDIADVLTGDVAEGNGYCGRFNRGE